MTQQDAVRLIRKLIFAKNSQDLTHFYRCVDEIAQALDEQGDKEGARAIRNTSRDGYLTHSHPLRSGILALCNKRWLEVFLRNRVEFTAVFELTLDLLNYGLSPFVQQFQ